MHAVWFTPCHISVICKYRPEMHLDFAFGMEARGRVQCVIIKWQVKRSSDIFKPSAILAHNCEYLAHVKYVVLSTMRWVKDIFCISTEKVAFSYFKFKCCPITCFLMISDTYGWGHILFFYPFSLFPSQHGPPFQLPDSTPLYLLHTMSKLRDG